eukprot:COSAG02_NODE_55663_length_289_cov_0.821053_1_plen_44_part_01
MAGSVWTVHLERSHLLQRDRMPCLCAEAALWAASALGLLVLRV